MTIRSILVPLDGEADNQAILENAFELARMFCAHVDVVYSRPDPRDALPAFGEGMSGSMLEDMVVSADKESQAKADSLHAVFNAFCEKRHISLLEGPGTTGESVSACWHELTGREDDAIARFGRLADVVVMARPEKDASPIRPISIEAALFDTGRPLLLFPQNPPVKDFGRVVAIAWDGSIPASRAVRGGMRIVSGAKEVHVITCLSECESQSPGDELAIYLSRWGVSAHVHLLPPVPDGVGDTILAKARELNVDLMVSGAYGHSKMLQTVMGGVTRTLLEDAAIPVFFSH